MTLLTGRGLAGRKGDWLFCIWLNGKGFLYQQDLGFDFCLATS